MSRIFSYTIALSVTKKKPSLCFKSKAYHLSFTGDLMLLHTETWNRSVRFFGESKVVALDISKAFDKAPRPYQAG